MPTNDPTDSLTGTFDTGEELPDPLPESPLGLLAEWFAQAQSDKAVPNPNAMTLATAAPDGRPSARIVLCKDLRADDGAVVFYTNRASRKGEELTANPRAAIVFHWDHRERQARLEGPVTLAPDDVSDAYFASRPWQSRLGAWASRQSQPLESRAQLLEQVADAAMDLGLDLAELMDNPESVTIPRPPHWGGSILWAERIELWAGGTGRVHDRAAWTRAVRVDETISDASQSPELGSWTAHRLNP